MKQIFGFNLHLFVNKEIKDLIKITVTTLAWNIHFVYVNLLKWDFFNTYFKMQ